MKITYDKQKEEWKECANNLERKKIAENWLREDTLDKWRHERMLHGINALITGENVWLTVGDGRYGTEANYILRNGDQAHASDMSDNLLRIGNERGFINSFSEENAENLSFEDESFDYVLIKEAFHHCPRPWLALHEAFRVCKKGVVLIEPNDTFTKKGIRKTITRKAKLILKILKGNKLFNKGYGFETVGNFIYSVNEREIEKFLLGMHYRHVAFKKINDFYINGGESIKLNSKNIKDILKIQFMKKTIIIQDLLTFLGFEESSILSAILFKEVPDFKTKQKLSKFKWNYNILPKNPYI